MRKKLDEIINRGIIRNEEDFRIKLNFSNFVRRFERENTSIVYFGTEIPYDKKIKAIYDEFRRYANEQKKPMFTKMNQKQMQK